MVNIQAYKVIKASYSHDYNNIDLNLRPGEKLTKPLQQIPGIENVDWTYSLEKHRRIESVPSRYLCFTLRVNGPVQAKCTITIDGTPFSKVLTKYKGQTAVTLYDFLDLDDLPGYLVDGKFKLICDLEFEFSVPWTFMRHSVFYSCEHIDFDFDLVVDNRCIKVHKQFISFISPVFHAALTHRTKEARTGKLKITDFEYHILEAAINFCYGRDIIDFSVDNIIGILRFADKYDIKSVIIELENLLSINLTKNTFSQVYHFASDCCKQYLLAKCVQFFRINHHDVKHVKEFCELPPQLVANLLETAFYLNDDFDILRIAHQKGIESVTNFFESALMENLTLETFSPTVNYAWDCSRDNLKQKCAKFFAENADNTRFQQFKALGMNRFCAVATEAVKPTILSYYDITVFIVVAILAAVLGIVVARISWPVK
uniref:BTB domain-containing protein n=1 Tax=Panagrellus redivivus TaxID=6233 RepID=A0A7E4VZC1_PANRE